MLNAKQFQSFISNAKKERKVQEQQAGIIESTLLEERVALFFDSILSRLLYIAGMKSTPILKIPIDGDLQDYVTIAKANLIAIGKSAEEEACSILDQAEVMNYMFSKQNIDRVEILLARHGYTCFFDQGLFRAWFCIEIPS